MASMTIEVADPAVIHLIGNKLWPGMWVDGLMKHAEAFELSLLDADDNVKAKVDVKLEWPDGYPPDDEGDDDGDDDD